MRRYVFLALLVTSFTAQAMASLRVGDKVLSIGDTAARVQELMGPPVMRNYMPNFRPDGIAGRYQHGGMASNELFPAEEWQYLRDGKTEIITIINGRAANFETKWN